VTLGRGFGLVGGPGSHRYAVKANSNPALLSRARKHGLGAEVSSGGELKLALEAGYDPAKLVLNGNGKTKESLYAMIEREGWSFYSADNAEEAIAAVNDIQPEVIVFEPRTDHGKARDLLVDIHQAGTWIPVILYTSDPTIDDAWALEHGASGLMRNPLGEALLRERIGELLNGRETDRPL